MAWQLELDHFLTLHMRSRKFPSRAAHKEISRILAALTDLVADRTAAWTITAKVRSHTL